MPAEISLIILAPASIAFRATSLLKVSIEIITSGNFLIILFIGSITLSNSSFTEICFAPGLEEYPPISIIVTPSLMIFSARLIILFLSLFTHKVNAQLLEKNQKSLTIYINKQERIRIYAKAPNRIRFEIVSLLKNVSQWLSGGKVRKNKAGVLRLIQQVKRKSTERINELLRYLLEATAEPTPEIIASDPAYVHTWANRFKNDPIAKQVLELLIANSRLVTGQSLNSISESVSAIIRKAQYHKLLVRKGKTLHACLPCQKNFTPELTQNQIKLINETQIETQTVSGSDEFVANTRVLERGRRIPPPPPFFLALRADYYELFWGLLFLMRDIKISTLGMEWLSCVYVR